MKRFYMAATIAIFLASCGTTARVENSWHDPAAQVDMSKLNKVLVLALFKNETNRRYAENQLVQLIDGKGVASYNFFTKELRKENEAVIKQKLIDAGFDGVVIMRLADVDKDIKYSPGTITYPAYYGRFWPYFWTSWGAYSNPGYFSTTKTFTIETNVYSFVKDKLIWSSLTSSVDPQNAEKLMDAVSKEVYRKMKKEGFVVSK